MSNIFDSLGSVSFDAITITFGYKAEWRPLISPGVVLTASVGYGEPIEGQSIGSHGKYASIVDEFEVYNFWMEYKLGNFPGLIDSVRDGNIEPIRIYTDIFPLGRDFVVQEVKSIVDGRLFKAKLQLA